MNANKVRAGEVAFGAFLGALCATLPADGSIARTLDKACRAAERLKSPLGYQFCRLLGKTVRFDDLATNLSPSLVLPFFILSVFRPFPSVRFVSLSIFLVASLLPLFHPSQTLRKARNTQKKQDHQQKMTTTFSSPPERSRPEIKKTQKLTKASDMVTQSCAER